MRVLITGCRGQLGRELLRQLKQGYSELGPLPEHYKDAVVAGVDIDDFDLADKAAARAYIDENSYDVVFNCAAYTAVDASEQNPDTAFAANALAVRNLAEICDLTDTKLVHISTDYVFDGTATEPYREYDLPNPQSVYGKTKYAGERYAAERCRRLFIVRTQWLYGYFGRNFAVNIMKAARERGALRVVHDQYGSPTNAVDLAHHLLKLAVTNRYGTYHCVNKGVTTWHDFTAEILRLSGIDATLAPCTTAEYPLPAKRPAYSVLDNMMLRLTVGDEMRDWKAALAVFIKNLDKENPQ